MQFLPRFNGEVNVDITFAAFNVGAYALLVETFDDSGVKHIDFANKPGNKQVFRLFVDFTRRAVLLNATIAHHHDPVRHGKCFFLVVSYEHECNAKLTL